MPCLVFTPRWSRLGGWVLELNRSETKKSITANIEEARENAEGEAKDYIIKVGQKRCRVEQARREGREEE